jgi:carboxyl-terminal processing protease
VGDRTFGKGLIQSLFDLSGDAGLAVTVAKYETPNHRDINKQGIEPDYIVTDKPETLGDLGTDRDPALRQAIELLAAR